MKFLDISKATIYQWESEEKAPLWAIRLVERYDNSTCGLKGWSGWKNDHQGIMSPSGNFYFLDELER